jgi:AAA15 family ATPase/GTPase
MLRSFSVKHFKGFKEQITLDLSKVKNYEYNSAGIRNGLVNKALIYGYNGIGKSNFALAIMDIVLHMTDKYKKIDLYNNYLNAASNTDVAEFSYTFQFNNDAILQYTYGKRNPESIVYESVSINDKRIISYNRLKQEPLEINLPGTETLNKDIEQIEISVLKYIKANAVLSKSQETSILKEFFNFVDNMLLFWQLDNRGYQGYGVGSNDILKTIIENNHFEDFKKFLKLAGLDSNISFERYNDKYVVYFIFENKRINFWESASTGMKSLTLFYHWFQHIQYEKNPPLFVFIDEFDAFYHIALARYIIEEIKSIEKCQIIMTTHDTTIMSNDLLRPDCYFFMYKDRIKSLAEATDKELRQAHNLEKMYRAGVFDV